jgi:hypothetical protein
MGAVWGIGVREIDGRLAVVQFRKPTLPSSQWQSMKLKRTPKEKKK